MGIRARLEPYRENGGERTTRPDVPEALAPPVLLGMPTGTHQIEDECDSDPLLEVGSLVGDRYVIEQHISSGGFGAVYRASDRQIRHHHVALKVLHRPSASEDERQAALRELKLLASVTHPSVVQFKEYGWHEGRLWFAMPWYRGHTLDRILDERTSHAGMSRAEARPLFTRLAHGLAAMHAMGVHHHDIKPENVFVAQIAGFPGGLPVLLDLGIATQRGENPVGLTVEYASPETAAAMLGDTSFPIGGAADVYSLALVLRNALDPSLATTAQTTEIALRLRARATEPAALSSKRELRYLQPHFKRWLSQNPHERPTAAELAEELALLTEPEDRRSARLRFVRRVVPAILLLGLMITGLAFQLRRKETALVVQERELRQEREQGEALRRQSAVQLSKLDQSAEKLGNERRLLKEALAFARKLNGQLTDVSRRYEDLDRRHAELTKERDALVLSAQNLTLERDRLAEIKVTLTGERAVLAAQNDELSAEVTRIGEARDTAAGERDKLAAEREQHIREIASKDARYEIEIQRLESALAQVRERERALAKTRAAPKPSPVTRVARARSGARGPSKRLNPAMAPRARVSRTTRSSR